MPDQRTSSGRPGWPGSCQNRKCDIGKILRWPGWRRTQRLTSAARPANLCRNIDAVCADGPGPPGSCSLKSRCMMRSIIRYLAKAALQSVTLAVVALPGVAHAQSGSTGGSIGNVDKSVSGTREAPRAVEPSKPARRSKPEAEEPRHASRSSGGVGGGGNFDGAWAVVSVGCGGTVNGAIVITSGRILGEGLSGHVSPNGSAAAAGAGGGVTWTSSGRFSSRSGAGSYRRSDGCVGSWTASKQ